MTAVHALCPVASVELGKAKIGAFQAQHACKRYNVESSNSCNSQPHHICHGKAPAVASQRLQRVPRMYYS